jgi:hypothetical protein
MRIITSLFLLCCCPWVGAAREEYRRDFQKAVALPGGRALRVEHSLGSVNVRTQAKNEVAVQAAIRCSADTAENARRFCDQIQIRVEESGSGVVIRTEYPRNDGGFWQRNRSYSANLEIQMPETAPLELHNRFGNVTVQKLRAAATIHNGNGSVLLTQGSGRQRVENSFGNVEVTGNDGDVTVVNNNGWVRASDIGGTAEITNRFGDVRATNVGKSLTVHGGNSKVEVEHVGGIAVVTTSFGDVRVWDAKSDVTVRNQNGKVEANNVAGTADLETSFAAIKFTGIGKGVRVVAQNTSVTGDTVGEAATVQTSFGNVDLRAVKGGARVTAGNTAIRMAGIGGEAYAKTSFAGVTVEDAAGPVTVENANGSVTVSVKAGQPCRPIAIQTSFAPIRVAVPAGLGYTVSGKTSFGRIHSEPEMAVSGALTADSVNGKISGGGCEMRLTDQNGNIDIVKR